MRLRQLPYCFSLLFLVATISFAEGDIPRGLRPSSGHDSPPASTPAAAPSSTSLTPTTVPKTPSPAPVETPAVPEPDTQQGVETTWFGHSFVYLVTKSGVRIAIDPFGERVKLPFPRRLAAEVVLISYDADDRDAGERLNGAPMVFRGVTGIGTNRAGGILFRGTESWRDASMGRQLGANVIYSFELDGVRFCHLGGIGYPLNSLRLQEIGHVDVLFVPVGNPDMSIAVLWDIAKKTEAKWIVPIAYQNVAAGFPNLRPLDDFLRKDVPAVRVDSNIFHFSPDTLPKVPTVLILKSP